MRETNPYFFFILVSNSDYNVLMKQKNKTTELDRVNVSPTEDEID